MSPFKKNGSCQSLNSDLDFEGVVSVNESTFSRTRPSVRGMRSIQTV